MKINNVQNQLRSIEHSSKDYSGGNVKVENTDISDSVKLEAKVGERSEEGNKVNDDLLKKSLDQANKNLLNSNVRIEREVHEVTHAIMYKLLDAETNEVIKEFPPKKIQDMIAKMWELAGLFVDEKA
ncbi:MAG: flagellar protein FlaG [Acidaminobacteraceae bacterium]